VSVYQKWRERYFFWSKSRVTQWQNSQHFPQHAISPQRKFWFRRKQSFKIFSVWNGKREYLSSFSFFLQQKSFFKTLYSHLPHVCEKFVRQRLSISSTFYSRIFHTKVLICAKGARKMLMTLTPDSKYFLHTLARYK